LDITLTENAALEIKQLMQREGLRTDAYLRIGIKEGGCAGMSYVIQFDEKKTDDDEEFESEGIKIVCDTRSYFNLAGIELDFVGGIGGQGFLFKNPSANKSCSCGKSFS
jgi:iron-sulfur cluster assembly protein